MRKLFLSFGGTMTALMQGRVTADDLATGLFVFGCTRDHFLRRGKTIEAIVHLYPQLYMLLVTSVIDAEADNRVRWRTREQVCPTYALVSELLVANGYDDIIDGEDAREVYVCNEVEARCRRHLVPLEAIF